MSRIRPQQGPPPEGDLSDFPSVRASRTIGWRAHSADHDPWWFSNSATGRFDLSGTRGTCYAADDVETAIREYLGPLASGGKTITHSAAARLAVTKLTLLPGHYANVTDRGAVRKGVHRELVTTTDYAISQAWASAFDAAGFAGIRYASRFTSEPGPNAWAMFGTRAAHDRPTRGQIDGATACDIAGVPVAPEPGLKRSFRLLTDH